MALMLMSKDMLGEIMKYVPHHGYILRSICKTLYRAINEHGLIDNKKYAALMWKYAHDKSLSDADQKYIMHQYDFYKPLIYDIDFLDKIMPYQSWRLYVCEMAASAGDLDVLKYVRRKDLKFMQAEWDVDTTINAASHGHLEVLKYAIQNDCKWDYWLPADAAKSGNMDVLNYVLTIQGWNESVPTAAIQRGHLHILKYAYESGCPFNFSECLAAARNYPEIIKWLNATFMQ